MEKGENPDGDQDRNAGRVVEDEHDDLRRGRLDLQGGEEMSLVAGSQRTVACE